MKTEWEIRDEIERLAGVRYSAMAVGDWDVAAYTEGAMYALKWLLGEEE